MMIGACTTDPRDVVGQPLAHRQMGVIGPVDRPVHRQPVKRLSTTFRSRSAARQLGSSASGAASSVSASST
jgi:hypothetical protein